MIQYLRILLAPYLPDRDDERGASAVEYGLLVAAIAGVLVLAIWQFYPIISGAFDKAGSGVASKPTT